MDLQSSSTQSIVQEALSYAASQSILMRTPNNSTDSAPSNFIHAPFILYPSPFHRESYNHALKITPALNTLVAAIASDISYLRTHLDEVSRADPFTCSLMRILPTARDQRDPVTLCISRFDYFLNLSDDQYSLRMVEMNCMAASYACLATKISHMHRFLTAHPSFDSSINLDNLPENNAIHGVVKGIAHAHHAFLKSQGFTTSMPAVVVMVVQPTERNTIDQDLLRITLWQKHNIHVLRLSLLEVFNHTSLYTANHLTIHLPSSQSPLVASVVYFRAGYGPKDYPTYKQWRARERIEKSNAVKCPTVAVQLVGTKKIQQVLDQPGEVERFVGALEAKQIRASFARQYSLSPDDNADAIVKKAIANPDDFVLKPQREGGGNNLYSDDLKNALLKMSEHSRTAFIIMERIRPPKHSNVMIRDGIATTEDVVSEFGVYGVHVGAKGEKKYNYTAGTLLRSKPASADDGGVSAGVALLDSVLLFD